MRIQDKNKEKSQNCWEKTTTEVSKKYNSLLKKYCHMQSEFRQVSIDEFISESNYVRKNAEIFNADSEFINDFNKFITELTQKTNTLIFFFIDDIDLSTNRCTDIIKTLLSYMSHPKIVTILSGDLDTFAEELTIDFLKKGDLLHKELLDISFINNGNENILERKKELAYEYLKKIIPPIYRHNLKTWSLKNRAQFKSATTIDGGKESDNTPLVELLADTFRDYDCEALFQYYDFNEEDENKRIKPIPQMFYMFDNTSRGLNNVYNALLQVNKYIKDDNNKKNINYDINCFQYIRNFLETVISSNKILNSEVTLLNDVISMGSTFENTNVNCWFFLNKLELNNDNIQIRLLTLFGFFDFSIRILKKTENLYNQYYKSIYDKISIDILNIFNQSKSYISKNKNSYQKAEYQKNLSPYFGDLPFLFHLMQTSNILDSPFPHSSIQLISNYLDDYLLALFSYKKVSKREFVDLSIIKHYTPFISEIFTSSLRKNNNKESIYISSILKPITNNWRNQVVKQFSLHFKYNYTPSNLLCNYISSFNGFFEFKNISIRNFSNAYLRDNKNNNLIKCILEIDDKNLWSIQIKEISFIINKIKENISDTLKQISCVEIKTSDFEYHKDYNNVDSLKIQDYFTFLSKYFEILNDFKYISNAIIKTIKHLTAAKIVINENEEEFKFWMYTYLRSNMHKIDDHDIYKEECIADLIDELYDFFEKNDIYDNSKKEEKLSPETIKTINELSKLEEFDFENTDEDKTDPNYNKNTEEDIAT